MPVDMTVGVVATLVVDEWSQWLSTRLDTTVGPAFTTAILVRKPVMFKNITES